MSLFRGVPIFFVVFLVERLSDRWIESWLAWLLVGWYQVHDQRVRRHPGRVQKGKHPCSYCYFDQPPFMISAVQRCSVQDCNALPLGRRRN